MSLIKINDQISNINNVPHACANVACRNGLYSKWTINHAITLALQT